MVYQTAASGNSKTVSGQAPQSVSMAQLGIITTADIRGDFAHPNSAAGRTGVDFAGSGSDPLGSNRCFVSPEGVSEGANKAHQEVIRRVSYWVRQSVLRREFWGAARQAVCMYSASPEQFGGLGVVQLVMNSESRKARVTGCVMCKSAYGCPVCAHRIAEQRRKEVNEAIVQAGMKGWGVYLVTLTSKHKRRDSLAAMKQQQAAAIRMMGMGKNNLKAKLNKLGVGFKGTIKVLETTWGQVNGWHPHIHMIVMTESKVECSVLDGVYREAWSKASAKAGLAEIGDSGVDVRDGHKAGSYVAKWGLVEEVTKGHLKQGRGGSVQPFQLLDVMGGYADGKAVGLTKAKAKSLYAEYLDAMFGHHMVDVSRGLYAELGVAEAMSEAEAAEQAAKPEDWILASMSESVWRKVLLNDKAEGLIGLVERLAKAEGSSVEQLQEVVNLWLSGIDGQKGLKAEMTEADKSGADDMKSAAARGFYAKRGVEVRVAEQALHEQWERWGGEAMSDERAERWGARVDHVEAMAKETYGEHLSKKASRSRKASEARDFKDAGWLMHTKAGDAAEARYESNWQEDM